MLTPSARLQFVPCRKQVVLTKIGENSDIAFYPQKQGNLPSTPEIDENDENGGCHPDKMTFCQKHCFDNPDFKILRKQRGFGQSTL